MTEKKVSSSASYVYLRTEPPHHREMITLALAHAVAARFRHRERGERIAVVANGNVRLSGRYNQASIQMSFYGTGLGVCDLSNRPRHRAIDLVEKILRSLLEEDLVLGRRRINLGRGRIFELGPKEEDRAACLVYTAILRHTRKRVANRVARQLSPLYPSMEKLIGIYPPRLGDFYSAHAIRE